MLWHKFIATDPDALHKHEAGSAFHAIGAALGWFAALVTFIAVYIAAVTYVGWAVGLALGWIPASLGAMFAFLIGRYTWWLLLIAFAGLLLFAANQ